jgi:hypothetical protein
MAFRVCTYSALSFLLTAGAFLALGACDKGEDAGDRHPPPGPPPAASSSAAPADLCADGGGVNTDAISAPYMPRTVGHYCLDPQGEPKTYGAQGKLPMDQVCTTAFDGECVLYTQFGLDRLVVLRYVDGTGAPNSVEVNLSRFSTTDGAYAMFTKRVVADGDPAAATVKPAAFGAVGATSSSNAYVWRGAYLVELTFVTEDTKMTPDEMAKQNQLATGAIAAEIGAKLPGPTDLPPAAAALPTAGRVPLGIAFQPSLPKAMLGVNGVGPAAVGYYKDGEKRWRDIAILRASADGAKEAFRAFKLTPGSLPLKGLGDEALQIVVQEAPDRAKAEYVVVRRGTLVAAVGDEELVLDPGTPSDKLAPLKLTRDEKIAKLGAWLSGGASAAPASSASAPASAPSK